MSICYIKNLPHKEYIRSGVIPYKKLSNGNNEFCFGIDSKHLSVGSFSGSLKKGESVVDAGLREFSEESLGVFDIIDKKDIMNCIAVYDDLQVIMFLPINWTSGLNEKFLKRKTYTSEMSSLVFYEYEELFNIIAGFTNVKFHWKVSRLLMDSIEINGDFMK